VLLLELVEASIRGKMGKHGACYLPCSTLVAWDKQHGFLLALVTSVSGCLSATIPFLIARVYSVDWDLALWVGSLPQQLKECDLTRGRYKVP